MTYGSTALGMGSLGPEAPVFEAPVSTVSRRTSTYMVRIMTNRVKRSDTVTAPITTVMISTMLNRPSKD